MGMGCRVRRFVVELHLYSVAQKTTFSGQMADLQTQQCSPLRHISQARTEQQQRGNTMSVMWLTILIVFFSVVLAFMINSLEEKLDEIERKIENRMDDIFATLSRIESTVDQLD